MKTKADFVSSQLGLAIGWLVVAQIKPNSIFLPVWKASEVKVAIPPFMVSRESFRLFEKIKKHTKSLKGLAIPTGFESVTVGL